jgi:transposase
VSKAEVARVDEVLVTIGIDTHVDVHVAVALDQFGRKLDVISVATTGHGHRALLARVRTLGIPHWFGVEGTGAYGAGLTRYLRRQGMDVVEVIRPSRQTRRRAGGKNDAIDAEAAARAVQAGIVMSQAKSQDGPVEMIRTLRLARRSAMKARTQAANQLHAVVVTTPQELRGRLRKLALVAAAARFRPGCVNSLEAAARLALKSLAVRYQQLAQEIAALDLQIDRLAHQAAPELMQIKGVGVDTAAALLVAAGDNPQRLRSEASFAHMCGVAPIPASSGKTNRNRLNRGGNREANRALYMLAINRLSYDPRAQAYAARRTAEGKTRSEIVRCLKRYLAREVFKALISTNSATPGPQPPPPSAGAA